MKKATILRAFAAVILCLCALCSCEAREVGWGSQRIDSPSEYGSYGIIEAPAHFPVSVDEYTVNAYYYAIEAWMDVCHEIFVDLTVTEEQLSAMLAEARDTRGYTEREAYYAEGYYEIIYSDSYDIFGGENGEERVVGYATVDKVIYNPHTLNVIYVQLHAHDTGVYRLADVKYFERFGIDENEYSEYTAK